MELDLTTVVSGAIGSLIAMAGSIIVAFMYIRNQNMSEKRRRFNEQIQETYIEQGILPIQEAFSIYGIGAVFCIGDIRNAYVRALKLGTEDEELLESKIKDISKRPTIEDLTQRKFTFAIGGLSYLRRFGIQIYGSVVRTLQHYSELLSDLLKYRVAQKQINEAGIDEFEKGATAVAQMIQYSQIYIQTRLDNLKDYIWQKDFENYTDFLNIFLEEKYKNFLSDFDEYNKLFTDWMSAMKGPDSEARKNSSFALSKWLHENTDNNPFVTS